MIDSFLTILEHGFISHLGILKCLSMKFHAFFIFAHPLLDLILGTLDFVILLFIISIFSV